MTQAVLRAPNKSIFVSQENIDFAIKKDSSHCMFADAIKDNITSAQRPEVDIQTIRWSDPEAGYRYVYLTPSSVQEAIVKWDRGEKIEPFTYKLKSKEAQMFPLSSLSEEQKADKREYNAKRKLVVGKANGQGREEVVGIVGGTPPPRVPGGRRRIFGIKAFRE